MRKIATWLLASLDGVIESPESWQQPYATEEIGEVAVAGMGGAGVLLGQAWRSLEAWLGGPVGGSVKGAMAAVLIAVMTSAGRNPLCQARIAVARMKIAPVT